MGSFLVYLKNVLFPALTSLFLYIALSYVILPFYRQHRQRYAHYLPLETLSQHTSTLRSRISNAMTRFLLSPRWLGRWLSNSRDGAGDTEGSLFDEEEGEGLVGFNIDSGGRPRIDRPAMRGDESDRRLSRELEEGFQDSSDDEDGQLGSRTALR